MRSIKPGRGPSAMGAAGGIIVAVFGVFWTIMASSMGAPIFFSLFGILFILFALIGVFYNYKNATGKNRMSVFDITEGNEEPDPLQTRFRGTDGRITGSRTMDGRAGGDRTEEGATQDMRFDPSVSGDTRYCPYCRYEIKGDFIYCPKCGKNIENV